jgi:hypothetical protein
MSSVPVESSATETAGADKLSIRTTLVIVGKPVADLQTLCIYL